MLRRLKSVRAVACLWLRLNHAMYLPSKPAVVAALEMQVLFQAKDGTVIDECLVEELATEPWLA